MVKLAAGDCSAGAAKTYDIEVYIPSMDMYYEVSSVSNVKEYQSRRGNMRYHRQAHVSTVLSGGQRARTGQTGGVNGVVGKIDDEQ